MIRKTFTRIFGSRNERVVKKLSREAETINALEGEMEALSDEELAAKTQQFRDRLAAGEGLDDLLPEAFATVREAGKRVYGMRHYDVQMIGGMVLNQGRIAEMRTGEGKTLVATLAVYLNALPGLGAHLVTVNDYLARRDAAWMGRVYAFLGMSTGVINSSGGAGPDGASWRFDADFESDEDGMRYLRPVTRKEAYDCDITYGTNNEFGFDYLRDNMAFSADQRVQRPLNFAVVDEVDSILIDEARTPLIISGPTEDKTDLYEKLNILAPMLVRQQEEEGEGDYWVDEKQRNIILSEQGHEHAESLMVEHGLLAEGESLYDVGNITIIHHLYAALRAHVLFQRDVHYIIRNQEIVIVDEFTGRSMPGRRWSDGLHQAVESKEGVPIQAENQTLASITFQNYFRMYKKLSGMTGTADTEAFEFQQIYGLEVVVIPTHRPMQRDDRTDQVYLTELEKYNAIALDIQDCIQRGQPVLVGTASIEASELLSGLLKKNKIQHEVLNAKQHEREANIVEQAGRPGAVTIATNMAGRGTDIVLGGNLDAALAASDEDQHDAIRAQWEADHTAVLEAGGLHVIGSERHESRRIDNQLRGRAGRQGDPGSSRFYLSLEDNLMRIFASERVSSMMQKLGMEEGEAIEHPWVNKAIENAQRKVEGHNFDIRKNLLEFDDVANDQRRVIYEQRNELMDVDDVSESVVAIREDVINELVDNFIPPGSIDEQWDVPGLEKALEDEFGLVLPLAEWLEEDHSLHEESLREKIIEVFVQLHAEKEAIIGSEGMRRLEKEMTLMVLDNLWKEHLAAMDYLRQGIYLRSYAQKKPQEEYKRESFEMFQQLLERVKTEVISELVRFQFQAPDDLMAIEQQHRHAIPMEFQHANATAIDATAELNPGQPASLPEAGEQSAAPPAAPFVRAGEKVGRNDPCPCGSGKKYKQCHGKLS